MGPTVEAFTPGRPELSADLETARSIDGVHGPALPAECHWDPWELYLWTVVTEQTTTNLMAYKKPMYEVTVL